MAEKKNERGWKSSYSEKQALTEVSVEVTAASQGNDKELAENFVVHLQTHLGKIHPDLSGLLDGIGSKKKLFGFKIY